MEKKIDDLLNMSVAEGLKLIKDYGNNLRISLPNEASIYNNLFFIVFDGKFAEELRQWLHLPVNSVDDYKFCMVYPTTKNFDQAWNDLDDFYESEFWEDIEVEEVSPNMEDYIEMYKTIDELVLAEPMDSFYGHLGVQTVDVNSNSIIFNLDNIINFRKRRHSYIVKKDGFLYLDIIKEIED